jgi:very-short-patch-repair endonuclease
MKLASLPLPCYSIQRSNKQNATQTTQQTKEKARSMAPLVAGINDLATTHAQLASEWVYIPGNMEKSPQTLSAGSKFSAMWMCAEGHQFAARVCDRKKGTTCPYCSGKKVLEGFNDLGTTHPELAVEWDAEKNGEKTPQTVSAGSDYLAHWVCPDEGHEYTALIRNRRKGRGCPYCVNQKVLTGFNDLATHNPEIAAEWDYAKNGELTPETIVAGSTVVAHWVCSAKSHEYSMKVINRTGTKEQGCPNCVVYRNEAQFRDMFNEMSGVELVSGHVEASRTRFKSNRIQVDMVNHEKKIVVEYDGNFSHGENKLHKVSFEERVADDMDTTQALLNADYKVIRIRETPLKHMPMEDENLFQISYKDKSDKVVVLEKCILWVK